MNILRQLFLQESLATTDNVTFNNITSTGTIQTSGTVIGNAYEGKLYDTNGNVILDNTSGAVGFGGNISSTILHHSQVQ